MHETDPQSVEPRRSSAFDDATRRCYLCKRILTIDKFRTITTTTRQCGRVYKYMQPSSDCRDCNKEYKRKQRQAKAAAEGRAFERRGDNASYLAKCAEAREQRKADRQIAWAICLAFWKLVKMSRADAIARAVKRQRERYQTDPDYWAARKALKVRRKRAQEGTQVERVSLSRVAERDGWVCSICGQPVVRNASEVRLQWSLDHVVPLSKGGAHTYENCKLAHRGCNSAKGNKVAAFM